MNIGSPSALRPSALRTRVSEGARHCGAQHKACEGSQKLSQLASPFSRKSRNPGRPKGTSRPCSASSGVLGAPSQKRGRSKTAPVWMAGRGHGWIDDASSFASAAAVSGKTQTSHAHPSPSIDRTSPRRRPQIFPSTLRPKPSGTRRCAHTVHPTLRPRVPCLRARRAVEGPCRASRLRGLACMGGHRASRASAVPAALMIRKPCIRTGASLASNDQARQDDRRGQGTNVVQYPGRA